MGNKSVEFLAVLTWSDSETSLKSRFWMQCVQFILHTLACHRCYLKHLSNQSRLLLLGTTGVLLLSPSFFLLTETHGLGKAKTEYFSTIISQHVSTELVHLGLYCARMLDFSNCWLIFYFFKKGWMSFILRLEQYFTYFLKWPSTPLCHFMWSSTLCSHNCEAQVFINLENAEDALCIL